jgi:hypothetical protein
MRRPLKASVGMPINRGVPATITLGDKSYEFNHDGEQ